MHRNNLTIVTGLFDIGRENLPEGFRRSFDHYLDSFRSFLDATKNYPLVVYIESKHENVVWEKRERSNTTVIVRELDYLRSFPFYDQVQTIRNSSNWVSQSGWMVDSPQAKLELYNPLVMMKQFMLNDATLFNPFDTKYFLWMDAGLTNTVNLNQYIDENFEARITPKMNKMLYLCFPYDGTVEVHGFTKAPMDQYAGSPTTYVARGGCFGGSKNAINAINDAYYGMLADTLRSGFMGTEESVFTILTYKNPELCNIHMIESNGLVYKFFEDLNKISIKVSTAEEVAIYVLTYNLPEQFKLFVESFKIAHAKPFNEYKKYVVNNSNDSKVQDEYAKLFELYGFEEFKFNNIGINSGRQFVAEHFDQTEHDYMIFFEDDMLLHEDDSSIRCRFGFTCWHHDLFDKALHILKTEHLDYLKFNFSEYYGLNDSNWAWFNVPPDRKNIYFPDDESGLRARQKTKISYMDSYCGLPYAIGQFHYCNWPLLFSKEGNKKVFLDIKWEYLYEQTWMSNAMTLLHDGKLRAGCLLASPINHHREYHYAAGTRRENKHYTN